MSATGDNLPNVIQYLKEQHGGRLRQILDTLSRRVPRLERVDAEIMADGRLMLQIKDAPFSQPILAKYASDGTLKMLAYLIVLYDPEPPQLSFQLVNRLAVEELEAWFFGDVDAMATAYPRVPRTLAQRAPYRDPDRIKGGTWEAHGARLTAGRTLPGRSGQDRSRPRYRDPHGPTAQSIAELPGVPRRSHGTVGVSGPHRRRELGILDLNQGGRAQVRSEPVSRRL